MLGGPSVLKTTVRGDADLEEAVTRGLPSEAVRAVAARTRSSLTQVQDATQIDKTTFARRERAKARLRTDESDRLVRVARIAAHAIEAMGKEDGLLWLQEPNRALGGRVPMQMLRTEVGARRVEDVLLRIQHGIYS